MQWQGLLPLVDHALASGGSVFLVGDGKQAIYRWRNGEVRQFLIPFIRPEGLPMHRPVSERRSANSSPRTLHANRRSGSAIIRFNNDLFAGLAGSMLPPELQTVYAGMNSQHRGRRKVGARGLVSGAIARHGLDSPNGPTGSSGTFRKRRPGPCTWRYRHPGQDKCAGKDGELVDERRYRGRVIRCAPAGGDPHHGIRGGPPVPGARPAGGTRALQQWARLMATEEGLLCIPWGRQADPLGPDQEIVGSMGLKDHQAAPADLILRILSAMNIDPGRMPMHWRCWMRTHAHAVGHGADLSGSSPIGTGAAPDAASFLLNMARRSRIMTIHRPKACSSWSSSFPFPEVGRASGKDLLW